MLDIDWRDNKSVIIGNLFVLLTGLFWRVDVSFFLLLYWLENIVAGVFNVLKMISVNNENSPLVLKLFTIPFFIVHYGVFNAAHLVFLLVFIGMFNQSFDAVGYLLDNFWLFLLNLGILVVEYVQGFLGWRRYGMDTSVGELMFQPYRRIVVLHLTIILGAFLYFVFYSSRVFLLVLMVMKTLIDIKIRPST